MDDALGIISLFRHALDVGGKVIHVIERKLEFNRR